MPDPLAIRIHNVSKVYKLYASQRDQLIDVVGLTRLGFKTKSPPTEFPALKNISLDVPKGHRIGIIGRNGAGKTTMLKLICGNFAATKGMIEVNGTVQALMSVGLGFHPEYTGRQNVEASLQYSGLERDRYQDAIDGIIEFCELGEFIDQPFKTYSMGMQARLMFAAATAIRPDILIVDEILGAGDSYFIAKSKKRVESLVETGCTMLLVSHSMQQILELCNEVIWLDKGQIHMQGEALKVVRAYEEHMYGTSEEANFHGLEILRESDVDSYDGADAGSKAPTDRLLVEDRDADQIKRLKMQVPSFLPSQKTPGLPNIIPPRNFRFACQSEVSRWEGEMGLKIIGFTIVTSRGETNKLVSMQPAKFVFNVVAEIEGLFKCRYGLVFYDHMGTCMIKLVSPIDSFSIGKNQTRAVEVILNPNQLGPGNYVISASLHKESPLELFATTGRYDLLNRSFEIGVEMPESIASLSANFFHTAEWNFAEDDE